MNNPHDEPLSPQELERFKAIDDVHVVFDVGARTSLDYLAIKPDAEYHLFEPNPTFYEYLQFATKDKPNVHVNPYALGDAAGTKGYSNAIQTMEGGENKVSAVDAEYPMRTLDQYIEENNITRIDFLKIDTEGYDYKVLTGGPKAVKLARYIQFEHWNDQVAFLNLLGKEFTMEDIGLRNYFCTRRV